METKLMVAALAALAQDTRLAIFRLLVQTGPTGVSVGEIAATVKVAPATLSFHLKELTHTGLIDSRQNGRFIFYSANYQRMDELIGFLTENCCAGDVEICSSTQRAPTRAIKSTKALVRNVRPTRSARRHTNNR